MKQANDKPEALNLYDFDGTIYDGDCSIDFFVFCLAHNPSLLRYFPLQIWHLILYVLKLEDKTTFKSNFFVFLKSIKDIDKQLENFWRTHHKRLKQWYLDKDHSNDVIISSSPFFLLNVATKELGVKTLLATDMDPGTGKIKGKNNYGEEKVIRFREQYSNATIAEAYTDRLSDLPMLNLAKQAYIVKKNKVSKYES